MLSAHFNFTVVNVLLISHMGVRDGLGRDGLGRGGKELRAGWLIVRGAVSRACGCWSLIAMAISPLPFGTVDPSQR